MLSFHRALLTKSQNKPAQVRVSTGSLSNGLKSTYLDLSTFFFQQVVHENAFQKKLAGIDVQNPKAWLVAAGGCDLPGEMGVKKTSLRPVRKNAFQKKLAGMRCAKSKGMACGSWWL